MQEEEKLLCSMAIQRASQVLSPRLLAGQEEGQMRPGHREARSEGLNDEAAQVVHDPATLSGAYTSTSSSLESRVLCNRKKLGSVCFSGQDK